MACPIGDFPDEILVLLLGFLPKAGLKSARLACIRWGEAGAERLFDRIFFAPPKGILEDFEEVSNHPVFGKNVRELIYDARLFRKTHLNYDIFKEHYDMVEDDEHDREESHRGAWSEHNNQNKLYRQRVSQSLAQYTMLYTHQQYILDGSHDYTALFNGFKQMPNITKITILDVFAGGDFTPGCLEAFAWYERKSKQGRGPAVQPEVRRGELRWQDLREYQMRRWNSRGMDNLFQALSASDLVLKELYIGSRAARAPPIVFDIPTIDTHVRNVMQNLTALRYDCEPERTSIIFDIINAHDMDNHLETILELITGLEFLSFSTGLGMGSRTLSTDIFLTPIWPNLKTLEIADTQLQASKLVAFAQAHNTTLRKIRFRCVLLRGEGGWEDAVDQLGRILKLEHVELVFLGSQTSLHNCPVRRVTEYCYDRIRSLLLQWAPPQRHVFTSRKDSRFAIVLPEIEPTSVPTLLDNYMDPVDTFDLNPNFGRWA